MDRKSNVTDIISWLFGIVVVAIGLVNLFWGNDPGFGVFLLLLSLVYFLPVGYSKNRFGHFHSLGFIRGG